MYFIFLLVFCYVILVRLPPTPPPHEMILIIFVFTLCTEEIRQVSADKTDIFPCSQYSIDCVSRLADMYSFFFPDTSVKLMFVKV